MFVCWTVCLLTASLKQEFKACDLFRNAFWRKPEVMAVKAGKGRKEGRKNLEG